MREQASELFRNIQQSICRELEVIDGHACFSEDLWERTDPSVSHGGGGASCILRGGNIFEQAGVNFSRVEGTLPAEMTKRLIGEDIPAPFFATGVSLVLHPNSPKIPTTHANYRYLEVKDRAWFGGGSDLTPYYLYEEDAIHFHTSLKNICDRFDRSFYPRFKKECDSYFYLPHRGEARGIGGIFFDYLGKDEPHELSTYLPFVEQLGKSFTQSYLPIVKKRCTENWTDKEKEFQLIRRGRYVEFNLVYDRGTLFGLKTGGRTESILMSLPPVVHWSYNFTPALGSREAALLDVLRTPKEWVKSEIL